MIRLVQVDQVLGEATVPERPLPQISLIDLDELEKALTWMAELHRLTRVLAERPDLSREELAKLSIAPVLMRTRLPPDMAEQTPAEVYEIASATIRRNNKLSVYLCDNMIELSLLRLI